MLNNSLLIQTLLDLLLILNEDIKPIEHNLILCRIMLVEISVGKLRSATFLSRQKLKVPLKKKLYGAESNVGQLQYYSNKRSLDTLKCTNYPTLTLFSSGYSIKCRVEKID